jgi:tetratricopeptide (TPR) repeat protein
VARDVSGDLGVKVRRGLEALRLLELGPARKEFAELAKRYPSNRGYQSALAMTDALAAAGEDLDRLAGAHQELKRQIGVKVQKASPGSEEAEVVAMCFHVMALALAERARRERGEGGQAGGLPVARFYVDAREAAQARACAEAALATDGESAAVLACLADAYSLEADAQPAEQQGRIRAEARDLYRRALVLDPQAVDLEAVVDLEVRDLVSLAELEYEVPGEPREWLATVGFLEGVLPIAHYSEADFARLGEEGLLAVPAGHEDSRAFYHYLRVSESHPSFGERADALRLEARKRLKLIAPTLYARYLQRF